MVLPWAASLFSGSLEQARGFSARAAMVFAAKALPANPLEPILYDVLRPGMIEPLQRLAAECSTARFLTGFPVASASREGDVFVLRQEDGRAVVVDDLVLASSGPSTLRLLGDLPGTEDRRAALEGIAWDDARIAIHTDPLYAPARPAFRSFLNCRVDGDRCEASMWLADVIDTAPSAAARVWKSWVAHRSEPPGEVLAEAAFTHMLPTAATIRAQETLSRLQGRDRIWLVGGYLHPYDSQETALRSALRVAIGLRVPSSRLAGLAGRAEALDGADPIATGPLAQGP
jgi:predicted NAD/FAD-binding protein